MLPMCRCSVLCGVIPVPPPQAGLIVDAQQHAARAWHWPQRTRHRNATYLPSRLKQVWRIVERACGAESCSAGALVGESTSNRKSLPARFPWSARHGAVSGQTWLLQRACARSPMASVCSCASRPNLMNQMSVLVSVYSRTTDTPSCATRRTACSWAMQPAQQALSTHLRFGHVWPPQRHGVGDAFAHDQVAHPAHAVHIVVVHFARAELGELGKVGGEWAWVVRGGGTARGLDGARQRGASQGPQLHGVVHAAGGEGAPEEVEVLRVGTKRAT